jgi:hypothetical protein
VFGQMLLCVPSVALLRALLDVHESRTPFCSYYLPSVLFDFVRIVAGFFSGYILELSD